MPRLVGLAHGGTHALAFVEKVMGVQVETIALVEHHPKDTSVMVSMRAWSEAEVGEDGAAEGAQADELACGHGLALGHGEEPGERWATMEYSSRLCWIRAILWCVSTWPCALSGMPSMTRTTVPAAGRAPRPTAVVVGEELARAATAVAVASAPRGQAVAPETLVGVGTVVALGADPGALERQLQRHRHRALEAADPRAVPVEVGLG